MAAITVKNIPDELYEKLKQSAQLHHRSINSELIYCLEKVLSPKKMTAQEHIARARALRESIGGGFHFTHEELKEIINEGRD